MYNIYQYQEDLRSSHDFVKQGQQYNRWLLKHQKVKNESVGKMKERVSQFINHQTASPSAVEDDHYQVWRGHRQFRDIEDPNKFTGFKAFRHKPYYDVGKYYSERERIEMAQQAEKASKLVNSRRIHTHLRSRSLRSQGPLNLEPSFREMKQDSRCIQPKMRYASITDSQRYLQRSVTFDNKLSKVYDKFDKSKSKIGKVTVTPHPSIISKLHMPESASNEVDHNQKFHYECINDAYTPKQPSSKSQAISMWISREYQHPTKTYFKTAKTMAVNGCPNAQSIMHRTQYDRKKDMTNIRSNYHNESFCKKPVL